MKNIRFTLLAITTYLFVAVILFSCCKEITWQIIAGESGNLSVVTICDDLNDFDCNISGPFSINFYAPLEQVSDISPQLITSAYGTSCEFIYLNMVDLSSVSLVFSENFKNSSGQIATGTNLNGLENISVSADGEGASFFFGEDFFEQLELESDTISVNFSGTTDDNIILSASTEIIFEL